MNVRLSQSIPLIWQKASSRWIQTSDGWRPQKSLNGVGGFPFPTLCAVSQELHPWSFGFWELLRLSQGIYMCTVCVCVLLWWYILSVGKYFPQLYSQSNIFQCLVIISIKINNLLMYLQWPSPQLLYGPCRWGGCTGTGIFTHDDSDPLLYN